MCSLFMDLPTLLYLRKLSFLILFALMVNQTESYDAVIYARALGSRSSGTHNLHFMEDADHNFTQHRDEVVEVILKWWDKLQSGQLKSGVWETGVRGKL